MGFSTGKKLLVTKRNMRSGSGALSTLGTNLAADSLIFTGKTALLMKNSFFSKMADDRGISLLCFFEVEVILEV